ncbi:MAG: amidohydrolase [Intestinimonas sp.]|jgi:5-methylthioadenosine/S-adenosylhomocysteine deaminase|nr:amidohydrolase [Intestinimonas sp.]
MSTLIYNCTAVLMDEAHTVLPGACVTVEGRKISSVGTARPDGSFDETVDAGGGILMPGLVNAHTHIPMTLMRGYGDGHALQEWLNDYIFPVEAKLDDRAVRAGSDLALCELIASGVTTIADMYMFCDTIAQEVVASGINANIARGTTLFTDNFDFKTYPACVELRELVDRWHGYQDGQILIDACIHGEYTSRPALWEALAQYAADRKLGMHIHVSETKTEHEECKGRWGATPIQTLDRYGVWDVRAIAAHCVWTTPEDWALMAEKGVSAVHNPASNLKLGSGVAPVVEMRQAGVNVCLGTDGVSSNNSHDLFEDMKLAALLQAGTRCDPLALSAWDALEMATVDGARALGRNTGRIEAGRDADLILLDASAPNLIPCHNAASNLVYAAHGSNVTMNMARGQVIYKNGEFFTIDLERVKREVAEYALPRLFG